MTRAALIAPDMPARLAFVAVLFGTLIALPAIAAEPDAEDSLYVSQVGPATTGDLAPDAAIVRDGVPMSIGEAIALSIKNSLDVEVARYAPWISETDREGAWGAYDPMLSADMQYDVAKTSNAIVFFGNTKEKQRVKGGGIGIEQLLPYVGASLGVRFDASSTATRRPTSSLDEQYDSSLFVTAKVPLARNLIWNKEWTQVKVSRVSQRGVLAKFSQDVMDNVQGAADLYWNLVAARDQVRVAQKSLETARALLDQTKTQYEVGVVSRVEVVEAEAGVAGREFDVITKANDYRNAQDSLIDAVFGPKLAALTDLQLSPTEDPGAFESREVDVAQAVARAFSNRPELAKAKWDIEQDEIELKFAKSQQLPQFDVEGRYGFAGISGENNVAGAGSPFQGPFDDSIDDWGGRDHYRVQGTFSIPLLNRTARKAVVKSELELRRAKSRKVRQEQTVILEVRKAARTLSASAQGIEAAERRRLAAQEQLRAERIRLEHGESTPFEVLQRESDLVEAESQRINALQAYRSAEIALERSQGTILDFHNVVLEEVAELRE